mmetsp:Transcript_99863/g.286898  ORF Transcript_99863/g.286898 Transcript_99863/m.286898 type:complete len:323 (+) Transcript_99863:497-1465(+)
MRGEEVQSELHESLEVFGDVAEVRQEHRKDLGVIAFARGHEVRQADLHHGRGGIDEDLGPVHGLGNDGELLQATQGACGEEDEDATSLRNDGAQELEVLGGVPGQVTKGVQRPGAELAHELDEHHARRDGLLALERRGDHVHAGLRRDGLQFLRIGGRLVEDRRRRERQGLHGVAMARHDVRLGDGNVDQRLEGFLHVEGGHAALAHPRAADVDEGEDVLDLVVHGREVAPLVHGPHLHPPGLVGHGQDRSAVGVRQGALCAVHEQGVRLALDHIQKVLQILSSGHINEDASARLLLQVQLQESGLRASLARVVTDEEVVAR